MYILNNQELGKQLSKYSGNPFLDAMVDLQGVFNTLSAYQQHKPYIDKYSDTSLSDLKDKIKANLPEAIDEKGNIDFNKLQELANNGNKMAEAVLGVKQMRENFANASIGGKLATFVDKDKQPMLDIISGNILTKQAEVLKKLQKLEEAAKKLPEPMRTILLANKEAFLDKPELLIALAAMYGDTLAGNTPSDQTNSSQEENIFNAPAIQSMQSIFDEKTNDILQSLIPDTSSSSSTDEKKKQVVNKVKQYINKKKSEKQSNKQSTNNKLNIETLINNPFNPLNLINTNQTTENNNKSSIFDLFKNAFSHPSSQPSTWLFNPINALIKRNQ